MNQAELPSHGNDEKFHFQWLERYCAWDSHFIKYEPAEYRMTELASYSERVKYNKL